MSQGEVVPPKKAADVDKFDVQYRYVEPGKLREAQSVYSKDELAEIGAVIVNHLNGGGVVHLDISNDLRRERQAAEARLKLIRGEG